MSQSQHHDKSEQQTQNQKNKMSDDPKDGSRNSDRLGAELGEPRSLAPEEKAQHGPEVLEAFGAEGAGVAPKE